MDAIGAALSALGAVIAVVVGYVLRILTEVFIDGKKQDREEQRMLAESQRVTLRELIPALQAYFRNQMEVYGFFNKRFVESSVWNPGEWPPSDLNTPAYTLRYKLEALSLGITDEGLRDLVEKVQELSLDTLNATTAYDAQDIHHRFHLTMMDAIKLSGELLRGER
jgi:hypothetical protein